MRTPAGAQLELRGAELQSEVAGRLGSGVEMMQLRNGIFDDAPVSVISLATIAGLGGEAGMHLDRRRFRANIVIASESTEPFAEDSWIGGRLVFGSNEAGPVINLTQRDLRCVMINLDPDTAQQDPRIMKAAVRLNQNNAGAYGTVVRTGELSVGQRVSLLH